MSEIFLLEDVHESAPEDAFSDQNNQENNNKENEGINLKRKAVKKNPKTNSGTNKAEKPAATLNEPIKKAAAKKVNTKKAEAPDTEPVKNKKAEKNKLPAVEKAKKQSAIKRKPTATEQSLDTIQPVEQLQVLEQADSKNRPVTAESITMIQPDVDTKHNDSDVIKGALRQIIFQLKFHTQPGQSLSVTGNHALLGNNSIENAFALNYLNYEYWWGILEIPGGEILDQDISYKYILKNADGSITEEWNGDNVIQPATYKKEEVLLIDSWNSSAIIENTFYTEPFQNVFFKDKFTEVETKSPQTVTHIFRVKAPLLAKGQAIYVTGSIPELGKWSTENGLLLTRKPDEVWHTIALDLSNAAFPFTYKYGVYDININKNVQLEDGRNRLLYDHPSPDKLTVVSDGFAVLSTSGFRGAGVAIPVFSLRSENSFGAGEFNDLKLLVDWAKHIGLKLIQILPVNDTTATHAFTDSYPYAAISAFALHPLYLHLPAILKNENSDLYTSLKEKQADLNSKEDVDYVAVMAEKWRVIKEVFPLQKQQTFEDEDFQSFFTENAHWLVPYAAFCYFREKYNTADFNNWLTNEKYDAKKIDELASLPLEADDEISMYYFVQYHLHLQLKDAAKYAHENGIIVKGDIPIGIYRYSCDAWQQPELFNMDMQAGAPPDDFAVKGQNWGFPTYNWKRMREDGFTWWKKRFTQMSYYFDAFRIDHILGFFRIWSIPMHAVQGIMGHFVPAVPVYINEFYERGIPFDHERFCKPYITDGILLEIFGNDTAFVKDEFLEVSTTGIYNLKSQYNTQVEIEEHFLSPEKTEQTGKIKEGLFDLISNVILFEDEGSNSQQFHFQIAMQSTFSYRYLDASTQYLLRELYVNYFYQRQDIFWMKEAMLKLPELKRSTNMLICGEDLGMVPNSVPGVMKELSILSLEIQRMPKNPAREFFHPNDAPYLSVVTPSTHDMSTIRGWWEEDRAATQRFFINELGQWGTAPYFCEPWINRIIVMQHLYSPAMWSIFQLQDLMGISASLRRENPHAERINIPADPKHYWRYRMHVTLQALMNETAFNNELQTYISQSGR